MFFLEALADAEPPAPGSADGLTVQLRFDGDPPGLFRLGLARAAANAIAADFLGEDAETLTAKQSQDVARELANMICGAVLSRIESRGSFRLSPPEIVTGLELPWGAAAQANAYSVETGNGTLTAAISMETQACQATEKSAF